MLKISTTAKLAAVAAMLGALAPAAPAHAYCRATAMPYDALPEDWHLLFRSPTSIGLFDGGQSLALTRGSLVGLLSLASPASPAVIAHWDLNDLVTCADDDCDAIDVQGTPDGEYFLVGTKGSAMGAWVFKRSGGLYSPAGNFDGEAALVGAHSFNGRHLGISQSLPALPRRPFAADLDTAPGTLTTVLATESFSPSSIPFRMGGASSSGPYVVLDVQLGVDIVLARDFGTAVPSLTTAMPKWSVLNAALGAAQTEVLGSVAAVVDPTDSSVQPRLFIFARFEDTQAPGHVTFRVSEFSNGTVTPLGSVTPTGTFAIASNSMFMPVGAVAVGGDVAFFGWAGDGDLLGQIPQTTLRLYNLMASDPNTVAHTDFERGKTFDAVPVMRLREDGSTIYAYVSTGKALQVIPISCLPGQLPDAGVLTPPPAASTPLPPAGSVVGRDAGCISGTACASADGCQTGQISCSTGAPTCSQLVSVADGTACGAGGQCRAGACVICHEGEPCDGPDGCTAGVWSCSGAPSCVSLSPKSDGAPCGTSKVCYQGQCISCTAGGKCTSADGCQTGKVSCATGQPACGAPWTHEADGTLCSGTGTCHDGVCSSCIEGAECFSQNRCQKGTISCGGGAVCGGFQDVADGTACTGGACRGGACVACVPDLPCETSEGCAYGTTNCNSGTVKCGNLSFKTNGTPCEGGVCSNGICKVPADAGAVVRRDAAAVATSDASVGEDAGGKPSADAGHVTPAPAGCGCQSGIGTAWSALALATGAMALRRRRPSTESPER